MLSCHTGEKQKERKITKQGPVNTNDMKYLGNRYCGLKIAEFERTYLQIPSTINLLMGQKRMF